MDASGFLRIEHPTFAAPGGGTDYRCRAHQPGEFWRAPVAAILKQLLMISGFDRYPNRALFRDEDLRADRQEFANRRQMSFYRSGLVALIRA
jgi:aspartyl-tRNA synthetase